MLKEEKIPTTESLKIFCQKNHITYELILGYWEELYKEKYVLNESISNIMIKFFFKRYDVLDEDKIID